MNVEELKYEIIKPIAVVLENKKNLKKINLISEE